MKSNFSPVPVLPLASHFQDSEGKFGHVVRERDLPKTELLEPAWLL